MVYFLYKKKLKRKNNLHYEYLIKLAKSKNLMNWKVEPKNCINFKSKNENAISKPSVIFKDKQYHMWFCYRGKRYKIGYASSKDGLVWKRKDNKLKFIGKNYNWDNLEKCYPSVVYIGGKIYMIYSGNNYGKTGIGYSVLK